MGPAQSTSVCYVCAEQGNLGLFWIFHHPQPPPPPPPPYIAPPIYSLISHTTTLSCWEYWASNMTFSRKSEIKNWAEKLRCD